VSDRDKLFTSKFWQEFCKEREIRRRLSTAHHPQTDGQTERTNQSIEKYLRTFCANDPDNWAKVLPEAEFAYNNSKHATIGVSPFEALYGYHPRMIDWIPHSDLKVQGVKERLDKLASVRRTVSDSWAKATEAQQYGYNRRHEPMEFKTGQWVGLSTRNFRLRISRKIAPTYIRVQVAERIGRIAYRLILPPIYSRMHDVFPVSLMEPWKDRDENFIADPSAFPRLADEQEEWEVEDIVDHKEEGTARFYLVKWAGWPVEYNTWEPAAHLENANQIVKRYHKSRKVHPKWDDDENGN
jgi:hypothetical protein